MTQSVRISSALWLAAASGGLIVWASAFVFLYAGLGLGCALGWQHIAVAGTNLLTALLAVLWIGHLVALAVIQWIAAGFRHRAAGPDQGAARFLAGMTCLIAAIGIVSTVFIGFPVLLLPPCA